MIRRIITDQICNHLDKKEITLISGPRQVGKTTLMNVLINDLKAAGKPVLFLSFDYESDLPFLRSQEALISRIKLEFGKQKGFVFIDEIQRKEDAGVFLKGLYDMQLPCKFIISGSGSIELKEKISESLAGRKRIFEVSPLSFHEFLDYRTAYKYSDRLPAYINQHSISIMSFFNEYLNFGGYPRVVTESSAREKLQVINEIYQSYIDRDIRLFLQGDRPESYARLIKLLAAQTGQILNLNNLANDAQLSVPTIRKYLWYAEKTYFLRLVTPYFNNAIKEITKSPVAYFNDHGMRNLVLSSFGNLQRPQDQGFVFQNIVGNLLMHELRVSQYTVHFWRTTDKAEVDFVINRGNDPIGIEVKFSALKKPIMTRSLRNFIDKYQPTEAWVVNLALDDKISIGKTSVRFVPFFSLQALLDDLTASFESNYQVQERKFAYKWKFRVSP
ncbi:MAG: ATP-binding protein [Bacteroidetes bacterium]|nr:ATP-binding protein [Bacteroidota bacterium]